jgi:hypothetical protein
MMKSLLLAALALSACRSMPTWVVLGPDGVAMARTIARGAACPPLEVDGQMGPMRPRGKPDARHPIQVCEKELPTGAARAAIDGKTLPLPHPRPARIAVIGDTGCRMKDGVFQACNDAAAWPFARLAAAAARYRPDLVIHVGDYIYRKAPCPSGNAGCAGSPHGQRWETLRAELFAPAAPLFRAAPWVVPRGNHERCNAGGPGFFLLLDPRPLATACSEMTAPYTVPAGDLALWVLDSSLAEDRKAPEDLVAQYRAQVTELARTKPKSAWLLSHRPLYAVYAGKRDDIRSGRTRAAPRAMNATLQAATAREIPAELALVLSGHIHAFELVQFASGRPAQIVAGNSGTALDANLPASLDGVRIAGAEAAGLTRAEFGFVALTRGGPGWTVELRDVDGKVRLACRLIERRLSCGSAQ